jgi:hypothetical protein
LNDTFLNYFDTKEREEEGERNGESLLSVS